MKLHHPLWTHLPALLLAAVTVAAFWRAWPLPDPAPVRFGGNGMPDRWGSPWEIPVIFAGASLLAIAISMAVDEAWARSEQRKRFNGFALIDELLVAAFTALGLQYLAIPDGEPYVARFQWLELAALTTVAGLAAAVLEMLRPHRLVAIPSMPEPERGAGDALPLPPAGSKRWAYWESQNPRYTRWYLPVFGAGLAALGISAWGSSQWAPPLALAMGALVILTCSGGFRVTVTPERLILRGGLAGIPLLRLPLDDITEVDVHTFSPLADFGGYGIRRNREMTAFFLQGTAGVRLRIVGGKCYLVGSDRPERLAAFLTAARSSRQHA